MKGQTKLSIDIKFRKLVSDLYRKIVVKVIDGNFIKDEEKKKNMPEELQN